MNRKKRINIIYTILLILFLLEVILLPIVVFNISEKESDSNLHTVTYEDKKLECDKDTDVDEEGTISIPLIEEEKKNKTSYKKVKEPKKNGISVDEIDSFDEAYGNAVSSDGTKIIAPGTDKTSVIRVRNKDNINLKYNAVLYKKATTENLPVMVTLNSGGNTAEAKFYEDVYSKDDIIQSVEGEIKPGETEEFEISWKWDFSTSDIQDAIDTELGNKAAFENPDEIVVGFRIIAEENNNSYIVPTGPKTGDTTEIGGYIVLMAISLFILILILIEKDKEHEKDSKYNF